MVQRVLTIVLQHPKERRSKCSLEPFRCRPDFLFITAQPETRFLATGCLILTLGAPVLTPSDAPLSASDAETLSRHLPPDRLAHLDGRRPLVILDSTWRYLPQIEPSLVGAPLPRSLPGDLRTAYPRKSKIADDPEAGLASIEALYAAWRLLGLSAEHLLKHYHWAEAFLRLNYVRS